jgi:hypothetical protein
MTTTATLPPVVAVERSEVTTPEPYVPTSAGSGARWWRVADWGVFAAWLAVVAITIRHHEKWVDEAQAWLFARDLSFTKLWFYELRYEGSPGLWHSILWVAQHVFHARYSALGYIGMAAAAAGAALMIFKAPFPRYLRWPLAFTYFLVYQYAVVARQYNMLAFFAFLAAIFYKDLRRPVRLTLVLMFLSLVSFHGTLLAGSIGLAYLLDAYAQRHEIDPAIWKHYFVCIGAMAVTILFIYLVLKPPTDSLEMVDKGRVVGLPAFANRQGQVIDHSLKLRNIVSGAFLDGPVLSGLFLFLTGAWCFRRRKLVLFVTSVGLELALYSLIYGTAHHHGTAFLAAITAIWIAWPNAAERKVFSSQDELALRGMTLLMLILSAVNIWDAGVAIHRDYFYPYSGAEDAANYLRSHDAQRAPIFGLGFGVSAVQAYFDRPIMANIPTSYTHNGLPGYGSSLDVEALQRLKPEYVVAFSVVPEDMYREDIPLMNSQGYEFVHFSDGYYFYKRGVYERETYFTFQRIHDPGENQH